MCTCLFTDAYPTHVYTPYPKKQANASTKNEKGIIKNEKERRSKDGKERKM
jgi:hypothetical protein